MWESGTSCVVVKFGTELGNSSRSSVNIPGAPPEITQRLVILTRDIVIGRVKQFKTPSLVGSKSIP